MTNVFDRPACNICGSKAVLSGCDHREAKDFDLNKALIKQIVSAVHDNENIVETRDFVEGVTAALIYLRSLNLLNEKA